MKAPSARILLVDDDPDDRMLVADSTEYAMADRPVRVLLVDDDEDYYVITRDLIADMGERRYELEWRAGFDDGLAAVLRGDRDVCLIDYRLGAHNGLELIRSAVAAGCQSPLILMTGQGDHDVDLEAMKAGAADYLIKGGVDAPLLERAIRYAIERSYTLQSLRDSKVRFRSAFDSAAIGMALVGLDGRFLRVNHALCSMLGRSESQLRETTLEAVAHPDEVAVLTELSRQILTGEIQTCQGERRFRNQQGSMVWVQLARTLVRDSEGRPRHFIAQIQDITARKQAEEALRQSEEQLRHALKMEAVGRLAGGIAHDFNNILTVITGYSARMLQELGGEHSLRHDLEEIQKSADRASTLIRQLLAFSRKQVLAPKVLDLNALVAGLDKMLRRIIGEDIELRTVSAPAPACVQADPGQLEQVVMNLVVNARDAMSRGGKLTIQIEPVIVDRPHRDATGVLPPGAYMMMAISDTGAGLTDEARKHLFEPFFTTKGLGIGTGLGLATSYGIVQQSNGHIHVYSEPGRGTTFKVYLPAAIGVDGPDLAAPAAPSHVQGGSERILVAEDEDAVRELAACVLRDAGYSVLEATNRRDALRILDQQGPTDLDLLVTDVIMPQMGGKELAERMRALCPGTKVLFMSGYSGDALSHHGVLDHGVAFVEKPFSPVRLAGKVREVLDA